MIVIYTQDATYIKENADAAKRYPLLGLWG